MLILSEKFMPKVWKEYKYYRSRRTVPQKNKNFHGAKIIITFKEK
jgi:hypothetical protein